MGKNRLLDNGEFHQCVQILGVQEAATRHFDESFYLRDSIKTYSVMKRWDVDFNRVFVEAHPDGQLDEFCWDLARRFVSEHHNPTELLDIVKDKSNVGDALRNELCLNSARVDKCWAILDKAKIPFRDPLCPARRQVMDIGSDVVAQCRLAQRSIMVLLAQMGFVDRHTVVDADDDDLDGMDLLDLLDD